MFCFVLFFMKTYAIIMLDDNNNNIRGGSLADVLLNKK